MFSYNLFLKHDLFGNLCHHVENCGNFLQKISFNWLLFCTFNFKEIVSENAGNRISEVLDFKIFRGGIHPDPPYLLLVLNLHPSRKMLDPPLTATLRFARKYVQ